MNFPLEESTTQKVPQLLNDILTKVLSQSQSSNYDQKDIFFILIIVLMTENKLIPLLNIGDGLDCVKHIDKEQLYIWRKSLEVYEATFIMSGFDAVPIKLAMCPLGSTVLISVILSKLNGEVYSVCLPISRYVVSPQASTIPLIFRDLKHFCYNFKNKIIVPVKSQILNYFGYASASLIGLPEEVLFNILSYLSPRDVVNIEKTSRRLKFLLDSNTFWHSMYLRDFKLPCDAGENSWKSMYKQAYITQKENNRDRRQCRTGALHDFMDFSDYVSYIDNPLWDDVIF